MREKLKNELLLLLNTHVDDNNLKSISQELDVILSNYEVETRKTDIVLYNFEIPETVKIYIVTKKISGLSEKSLYLYNIVLNDFFQTIQKLNDKAFYLEDNYIVPDKTGLIDLYNKFVKYIINYHFKKLYQLTSRSFISGQPIFNNQKDVFLRRVERLGFGDMFQKYDLKLDI